MRYSSIDKPVVDLSKRQSAIVTETRHLSGQGKPMTRGTALIDDDAAGNGTRQIASGAKSNGCKGSSRGSMRRRVFGSSNGNGYYTNITQRVNGNNSQPNGTSIAPKDAYEATPLLSDEK
jgi:hypothetical protein